VFPYGDTAERALQLGQSALDRDRFEEAIAHFQHCLKLNPALSEAHLSLAAAHLALGQDREAIAQMGAYLVAKPDHFLVRMPYAEVLVRLNKYSEASAQLELFIAAVQDNPRLAEDQLVASHTRRMEVATRQGDEYAEHLHRGIGLYHLATKRAELGGEGAPRLAEELLCKAAGELTVASLLRPEEARPAWYLHGVWRRLGQRHPAERSLIAACRAAGLSYLTPAEYRQLHLAENVREWEQRKR
jgi:tetratricopeptide (TPR) repeat protein